jgi:hypothetical protein
MTTIAAQIAELHRLAPKELAERYATLFGREPRVRNKAWLLRQVAWKVQERELGGLSDRAQTRLRELMAQVDLPLVATPPSRSQPKVAARANANAPMVGTVLVREWHDQRIEVRVVDDGFEWNGARYTSLSAVAKAITGAAWNGRLFFGLTTRRSAS